MYEIVMEALCQSIFEKSCFTNPSNKHSKENLKKSCDGKDSYFDFLVSVSEILNLDEVILKDLWEKQFKNYSLEPKKENLTSLDQYSSIQVTYFDQRRVSWYSLQETIRIDNDPEHNDHSECSQQVEELHDRNIISTIIQYLNNLLAWTPNYYLAITLEKEFSPESVYIYLRSANFLLAEEFLQEIQRCLETLILLCYSRKSLSLHECSEIMSCFSNCPLSINTHKSIAFLLENALESETGKIESMLQLVNFKLLVFFGECLQLWRSYGTVTDAQEHPLLDGLVISVVKKVTRRIFQAVSDFGDDVKIFVLIAHVWDCFLISFSPFEPELGDYVSSDSYQHMKESISAEQSMVSALESTLNTILLKTQGDNYSPPGEEKWQEMGPDFFIYCSVLQEILNVMVNQTIFLDKDQLDVSYLEPVTSLIEYIYRGRADLCEAFWAAWEASVSGGEKDFDPLVISSERCYPLCRLLIDLLYQLPNEPGHLFRLLCSVGCNSKARLVVMQVILCQPVQVVIPVSAKSVEFIGESSESKGNGSQEIATTTDQYQLEALGTRIRLKHSFMSISNNFGIRLDPGEKGDVIAMKEEGIYLVRWDRQCEWWAIILGLLVTEVKVTSASNSITELVYCGDKVALFQLLDVLLQSTQQKVLGSYFLSQKWEQHSMCCFLSEIGCEDLIPTLVGNSVMKLRNSSPAEAYQVLLALNIPRTLTEHVVTEARNSRLDCFCLSGSQLLAKSISKSVWSSVSTLQASTGTSVQSVETELLLSASLTLVQCVLQLPSPWGSDLISELTETFRSKSGIGFYEVMYSLSSVSQRSSTVHFSFRLVNRLLVHVLRTIKATVACSSPLTRVFSHWDADGDGIVNFYDVEIGLEQLGIEIPPQFDRMVCACLGIAVDDLHYLRYSDVHGIFVKQSAFAVGFGTVEPGGLRDLRHKFIEKINSLNNENNVFLDKLGEFARGNVIFSLNFLALLLQEQSSVNNVELRCAQLSECLKGLRAAVSFQYSPVISSDSASQIAHLVLDSLASDPVVLEGLLQLMEQLGLLVLSLRDESKPSTNTATTFKDLLTIESKKESAEETKRGGMSGITLPIHFEKLLNGSVMHDQVMEDVISLSHVASSLIDKLLDFALVSKHEVYLKAFASVLSKNAVCNFTIPAFYSLSLKMSEQAFKGTAQTRFSSIVSTNTSYFTVLVGMISLSYVSTHDEQEDIAKIRLLSLRTVVNFLRSMIEGSNSLLVDWLGIVNIPSFCLTLCSLLESTSAADEPLCMAVLDLLLLMATSQPLSLGVLLSVSNSFSNELEGSAYEVHVLTAKPEESKLIKSLTSFLSTAEALYEQKPLMLHLLYQLFQQLIKAKDFHGLASFTLFMIQAQRFWDFVTYPLMMDAPIAPLLENKSFEYQDSFFDSAVQGLTAESVDNGDQGTMVLVDTAAEESEGNKQQVQLYCQQMLVHSSSLQLLSLELYGCIYELDVATAVQMSNKVQAFFVKATECHRFVSWIKHYLLVHKPVITMEALFQQGLALGQNPYNLFNLASDQLFRPGLQYGGNYYFSSDSVRNSVEDKMIYDLSSNLKLTSTGKIDISLLKHFCTSLDLFNCSVSMTAVDLIVVQSWRTFLEFYVLPGSALRQFIEFREVKKSVSVDATPTGSKNKEHDGIIPESPVMGSLSPMTNQISASPMSLRSSSFTGDKRSYDIVGELATQLVTVAKDVHAGKRRLECPSEMVELSEKVTLLVSMLHHQLKVVAARAADPGKSEVHNRDAANSRLTQEKMEQLLEKLDDCYGAFVGKSVEAVRSPWLLQIAAKPFCAAFSLNTIVPPISLLTQPIAEQKSEKENLALRLLTGMELLLGSIYSFDSSNDIASKLARRRRSVFFYATTALRSYVESFGVSVLAMTNSPESTHSIGEAVGGGKYKGMEQNGLIKGQAIVQASLQVMKLSLPDGTTSLSLSDSDTWRETIKSTEAMDVILVIIQELFRYTASLPKQRSDFKNWNLNQSKVGDEGSDSFKIPSASSEETSVTVGNVKLSNAQVVSLAHSLSSVLEVLISMISSNVVEMNDLQWVQRVLPLLLNAPLLVEFQQTLLTQFSGTLGSAVAVVMGYDSRTGEVSMMAKCWSRVVHLLTVLVNHLSTIDEESLGKGPGRPMEQIASQVFRFIKQYSELLFLPLQPVVRRYSLQQIALSKASATLFAALNNSSHCRLWQMYLVSEQSALVNRLRGVLRGFSLLLWHGDDQESYEQQRRMQGHSIAVSKFEKQEESLTHVRKEKAQKKAHREKGVHFPGSNDSNVEHRVHFGTDTVFHINGQGPNNSAPGVQQLLNGTASPVHPIMRRHQVSDDVVNSSSVSSSGVQREMVFFLIDVEARIVAAMVPMVTLLRQFTPENPLERTFGTLPQDSQVPYPPGQQVYYWSDYAEMLLKGIVEKVRSNGLIDVRLPDQLMECNIHPTQVKYTVAPLLDFQALSDVTKRSIDNDIKRFSSTHTKTSLIHMGISTAHLLKSLQMVTSNITFARFHDTTGANIGADLCLLAQQLTYVIVANMDHHSYAPCELEEAMIQQLIDIRTFLRPREGAGNGGSHQRTGGWMRSSDWLDFVEWIDKWCEEIFFRLEFQARQRQAAFTFPDDFERDEVTVRDRKKRIGLRAKIDWAKSPDEV